MSVLYLTNAASELGYSVSTEADVFTIDFGNFTLQIGEQDIETMTNNQIDSFLEEACKRGWYNTWHVV